MPDTPQPVEIPNRSLFKASEVCELAKVQPYVLRSWESEFKDLGVVRNGTSARVYRREDVERVLRIKHLLLIEGLTLAGVRRRLEEVAEPPLELDESIPVEAGHAGVGTGLSSPEARARIEQVKRGLQTLLELLGPPVRSEEDAVGASPGAAGSTRGEDAGVVPDARDDAEGADRTAEFALSGTEKRHSAEKSGRRGAARDGSGSKGGSPRRKRSA
jgi:DNA-binding transcriptional MerR regulator